MIRNIVLILIIILTVILGSLFIPRLQALGATNNLVEKQAKKIKMSQAEKKELIRYMNSKRWDKPIKYIGSTDDLIKKLK